MPLSINTKLILLFCLLSSIALVTINADDEEQQQKQPTKRQLQPEDWQPIHYEAYATSGHFLKPNKTLELLKKLEIIYEPYDDLSETNGRKGKVRQLVAASELERSKCTRDQLAELLKLRDYVSPYKRTIVPYVGHALVEYLDYCEDNLLHNLHDGVRDMSPEHRLNIRTLTNHITQIHFNGYALGWANLGKVWMHFTHLIEGLVLYMRLQLGNKFEKLGPQKWGQKRRFKEAFDEHVMEMCKSWMSITDPIEAFHELDLRLHYDEEEFEWIKYGKFCHFLDRHKSAIRAKTWRQFKRRESNFARVSVQAHRKLKALNCFDPFA